ncbi:MAG: hypothetical protein M3Q42_14105 [Pseudomonadota bacterium]|nr:hypothetical protein [Pseudomonadota bacterium]
MNPSDIESMTLKQLRATRNAMFSAQWMLAVQDADPATKTDAARQMLMVNHAIVVMENKELSEIRDQLVANEAALTAGSQSLSHALADLDDTKAVLSAVSGFLGIVGRIVPLMAGL